MKQQPEFILQKQLCQYLRIQYPSVYFLSDTVASVKLTIPQQQRNKDIQCPDFKCPDLLILEPKNGYSGLFIELKIVSPFKLNGEIKASQNDHLLKQHQTIIKLQDKGYFACFGWSFDMVKNIIDNYINNTI